MKAHAGRQVNAWTGACPAIWQHGETNEAHTGRRACGPAIRTGENAAWRSSRTGRQTQARIGRQGNANTREHVARRSGSAARQMKAHSGRHVNAQWRASPSMCLHLSAGAARSPGRMVQPVLSPCCWIAGPHAGPGRVYLAPSHTLTVSECRRIGPHACKYFIFRPVLDRRAACSPVCAIYLSPSISLSLSLRPCLPLCACTCLPVCAFIFPPVLPVFLVGAQVCSLVLCGTRVFLKCVHCGRSQVFLVGAQVG